MFSVWLGILTPATEGDKEGKKEMGAGRGGQAVEESLGNFPTKSFEPPQQKTPWKAAANTAMKER